MTQGFRSTFAVFGVRNYRLFWVGGVISNTGRWCQAVAIPIVVWGLTDSAGWVGLAGFAQIMPMAVMGPVGGAIADRYQRRRVLIATQSLQACSATGLALLWFGGVRSPTAYVAMSVLVGLTAGLNLPAWQAIVSELVPRQMLLAGITLNSAQFNASRMIGPALAGLLIDAWGPGWAFVANAVSYSAVLYGLARMRMARRHVSVDGRMRPVSEFLHAARYCAANRGIRTAIATVSLVGFFGLSLQLLSVAIVEDVHQYDERGFGLLLSCVGLGAVLASPFVASSAVRFARSRIVAVALVLYAAGSLVIAFAPWFTLVLVGGFAMGVAHIATGSTLNTAIQLQVDEAIRAKVLAVFLMMLTASNPAGQLVLGWLIDAAGPRAAYAVAGGAFVLIAAWLAASGRLAGLDLEGGGYEPASLAEVHPSTPAPPPGYGDSSESSASAASASAAASSASSSSPRSSSGSSSRR